MMVKTQDQKDEYFFGKKTDDPLRYAFKERRIVHPFIRSKPIPKEDWQKIYLNLLNLSGEREGALYLHIPFCETHCLYCGFFQNFYTEELEKTYVSALKKEIESIVNKNLIQSKPFTAIYLGGGTPSALSAKNIKEILKIIRENIPLANDCEITFEARFYNFTEEKIEACLEGGINRFSLGVQSFNTKVRKTLGRKNKREKVLKKLKYLTILNKATIIIDLIYGLPFQDMEVWEKDLEELINTDVDGADLYALIIYKGGRLERAVEKGSLVKPATISEQALMFAKGVEFLKKFGLRRVSMTHWARNERERSYYNFLSARKGEVFPLGSGAGGRIKNYGFFIQRDTKRYIELINQGESPIMFMVEFPKNYKICGEIIGDFERGKINFEKYLKKFELDLKEKIKTLLEAWEERGLIIRDKNGFKLTLAGQFWYVNLTQAFLDWLFKNELYLAN